jgi:hypothetical protein
MKVNIIKGDKVGENTDYRDNLPVNMYGVEKVIFGSVGYMRCYPGLTKIADGVGTDRGGFYNDRQEEHFRVSGQKLITVATDGTVTELGTVSGTTQARLCYSFNTQAVITDGNMYLYDPAGGFRQVTDPDLGSPIDVVWVDGYYFLTDGEYIYHTDISDEESIDPLKFATAEFMPDASLGLGKTQDNKVIVFGRYTIEYFVDSATENFAFSRVETRAQKIGIVATHAKCEVGGTWYITGGRRNESVGVHRVGLGATEKISSREVDRVLAQYTEPELADMRMESRKERDMTFVILRLPNETLCFNENLASVAGIESAWSILKTDITGDTKYRGVNGTYDPRTNQWVYGDNINGNIGKLDEEVFTHYDQKVEWLLYTPFLKLESTSLDEIEIQTIPGHTIDNDATVAVSLTMDGLTYSKEWFQMYGEPSDYNQRFIIRRLGYVNNWIGFKFRGVTTSRMAFAAMDLRNG